MSCAPQRPSPLTVNMFAPWVTARWNFCSTHLPSARALNGALVALVNGKLDYLDFTSLRDPQSGKTRVRRVDIDTPSYKVAREYMIRLEREDFSDPEKLRLLSQAASSDKQRCTPEQFRDRYQHITTEIFGAV